MTLGSPGRMVTTLGPSRQGAELARADRPKSGRRVDDPEQFAGCVSETTTTVFASREGVTSQASKPQTPASPVRATGRSCGRYQTATWHPRASMRHAEPAGGAAAVEAASSSIALTAGRQ